MRGCVWVDDRAKIVSDGVERRCVSCVAVRVRVSAFGCVGVCVCVSARGAVVEVSDA